MFAHLFEEKCCSAEINIIGVKFHVSDSIGEQVVHVVGVYLVEVHRSFVLYVTFHLSNRNSRLDKWSQ